jgi:RNA polymerase sigma-70 factor (ECF subfamily)
MPSQQDAWRAWPPSPGAVEVAQNGDHDALEAIITAAIPKLVAFYRGQGMRPHDAEDLAGDACEAVVRALPRLRDAGRFEAWFWRIARSKLYDHLRHKQKPGPRPVDSSGMFDDPSDLAVIADDHEQVRRAFATLSARDRELLWMRDVVGLSYREISGRFRLTQGAVRIAVMRARQRLERALGEPEGG